MYDWTTDLSWGQQQEKRIVDAFPTKLTQLDGFKGDIRINATGAVIEVKSERRSLTATENYAVEVTCSGVPSGPWKALADGCEYYGHFWTQEGELHLYRTADFVRDTEIAQIFLDPRQIEVGNAVVLLVPRSWYQPKVVKIIEGNAAELPIEQQGA